MAEREKLIELKDLQITFGSGKKKFVAVDHVNFDIYKGETFSLVGESGSGKTTLAALIPRFYEVSGGKLLIDDWEVAQLQQKALRANIGIVQQTPFLFDTTIRENILFGKPGAGDAELIEAARLANILDFISCGHIKIAPPAAAVPPVVPTAAAPPLPEPVPVPGEPAAAAVQQPVGYLPYMTAATPVNRHAD